MPITCLTAQIYKQEFRFGLGGVSLGNEFNKHTDKEAEGTLEATWEVDVRYFDVALRKKNVSLVIGSSLNSGFISGSPRYNYGKENFKIPAAVIEKREKLRTVFACAISYDVMTM